MAESLAEKVRRKRFEEGSLHGEELSAWLREHPDLQPEGWEDPNEIAHDPSLVPDIEVNERQDDELQPLLDRIDILDAYARWGPKFTPKVGNKRESIKILCPNPAHPEKDPSAWVNLDKQVWACGHDFTGGDMYDLAAWHFDFNVPGYKTDGSFPELRRRMVEDFGYVVRTSPGGKVEVDPIEEIAAPEPEPEREPTPALVVPIPTVLMDEADEYDDLEAPDLNLLGVRIDWDKIVPPETFMDEWMQSTTIDDLPHEYYFWMGMAAISAAVGSNVILHDYKPIKGNLFLLAYGKSGSGKSRAKAPLDRILNEVIPFYKADDYTPPTGVKILPAPGSAEALLSLFQHEILDPSTNKPVSLASVRGVLTVEEFSSFVSRSARSGNPMKETLIELYDAYENELTHYSRSGGLLRARNPYVIMISTTQPQAIHAFMKRTDVHSGFMNRFIISAGLRRRSRIAHGGVEIDINDAAKYLDGIYKWSLLGHEFNLTGDALEAWTEFYNGNIGPLYDASDESMFSRIDLQLKKIILLLTANEKLAQPTADVVERACNLFGYLRATYSIFSRDIALDDAEEARESILNTVVKYTKKHKQGPTRREIVMRLTGKHGMDNITKALAFLEQNDIIEIKQVSSSRGPKTRRYFVNAD